MLYGYARAGKTTIIRELIKEREAVCSTSYGLDLLVCRYLRIPEKYVESVCKLLQDKNDEKIKSLQERVITKYHLNRKVFKTCRDLKIHVAEEIYIPKKGRKWLVDFSFDNMLIGDRNSQHIYLETIGGEEAEIVKSLFPNRQFLEINIRSDYEMPNVDIRKLAENGINLETSYLSPLQIVRSIKELLDQQKSKCDSSV